MKNVSPYTTKLHEGNAYWMARLARIVYEKESDNNQKPDKQKILDDLTSEKNIHKIYDKKFKSVFGVNNNSAQAALIEHEEYLCMSFRGTNELEDWLDNIRISRTEQLFGEFHRGFWNSVQDIWEPMYTKYNELKKEKKRPLFFTGHSLGGAMATIAAAKFVHEDIPFTSVYTFGQPRAMTKKTAQIFNTECKSRFFRFQNNNDIVTRVPARIMGYSHVGNCLYISEEKEINKDVGFWFKFIDSIDGVIESLKTKDGLFKSFDAIADHDMNDYLQAIEQWNLKDKD